MLDDAGAVVAGGPVPVSEAAAGPVARLWEAAVAQTGELGDVSLDHVVVPAEWGAVAVVQAGGHRIVALTGPQPAVGLLLFDLRTCLSDAFPAEEELA